MRQNKQLKKNGQSLHGSTIVGITFGTLHWLADQHQPDWLKEYYVAHPEERPPRDDGLTEAQRTEIARLAALSPLQYDQQRKDSADRLGIRVLTLDDYVARHGQQQRTRRPRYAT